MVNSSGMETEQGRRKRELFLMNKRIRLNNSTVNDTSKLLMSQIVESSP